MLKFAVTGKFLYGLKLEVYWKLIDLTVESNVTFVGQSFD